MFFTEGMQWSSMHRSVPLTKTVQCPKCGLRQQITFTDDSVGVEQRCIGCDEFVWFVLPPAGSVIKDTFKRLFG